MLSKTSDNGVFNNRVLDNSFFEKQAVEKQVLENQSIDDGAEDVTHDSCVTEDNSFAVDGIILEEGKPFSKCALWDFQRKFFEEQGANAWDTQVPFYITSNPSIANAYATMAIRFIQDWYRSPCYSPDEVILGKYRYGQPTNRYLQDLRDQGLSRSRRER